MTSKNDLWPTDLLSPSTDVEPRLIVEEQAVLLGEHTQSRVIASVRATDTSDSRKLISMVLTTPASKDYEYVLLAVDQPPRWYPCRLTHEGVTWVAETEMGFRNYLASCLQSTATRKIVASVAARVA